MDPQNIAVLWNDNQELRISILNLYKPSWRHVRTVSEKPV
jgi:hypothetical protein